MIRTIYASTKSPETTFDTVLEILTTAHQENKQHGISGMLIFDGEHFLQCIEGEEDKVKQLLANIEKDPRHHSIFIIGRQISEKRYFPNWTMGYVNQSKPIREIFYRITGDELFDPSALSMEQAETILTELSFCL